MIFHLFLGSGKRSAPGYFFLDLDTQSRLKKEGLHPGFVMKTLKGSSY